MSSTSPEIRWNTHEETARIELARFVQEDLPVVRAIVDEALDEVFALTGDRAWFAYESKNPKGRAPREVEAVYRRLQRGKTVGLSRPAYVLEPADSTQARQRIRLFDEVWERGVGVCLDWVLLLAACVSAIRIYPLVVIASGHAMVGYWVRQQYSDRNSRMILDKAAVQDHLQKRRIRLVNATRIPELARDPKRSPSSRPNHATFAESEEEAKTFIASIEYAIDIRTARERFIRPIPEPDVLTYLHSLLGKSQYMNLEGFRISARHARPLSIRELYIELTAQDTGESSPHQRPAAIEDSTGGAATDRSRPLGEAVRGSRRCLGNDPRTCGHQTDPIGLVVLGPPGAGKTTFLQRLTYEACLDWLDREPGALAAFTGIEAPLFPVPIRVSEFIDFVAERPGELRADSEEWLPRFLAWWNIGNKDGQPGEEPSRPLDERFFRELFQGNKGLLLIDGLDEATDEQSRAAFIRLIQNAGGLYRSCAIVVTSRPTAYQNVVLSNFTHKNVEKLKPAAIKEFLGHWAAAIHPGNSTAAAELQAGLERALTDQASRAIQDMASNPVMLTALAIIYWSDRKLPQHRWELYERIVEWLASARRFRDAMTDDDWSEILQRLALAMHRHAAGRKIQAPCGWAAEMVCDARAWREEPDRDRRIKRAESFLKEEERNTGIIIGLDSHEYELQFWHLSFQEFLVAQALGATETKRREVLIDGGKLYLPEWRECVLLLAGVLWRHGKEESVDGFVSMILDDLYPPRKRTGIRAPTFKDRLLGSLGLATAPALAKQARTYGLLGLIVRDLPKYVPKDHDYRRLQDSVMAIFDRHTSEDVPINVRIEAAEALGQAGDPRLDPSSPGYWVSIPAGRFWMGAQKTNPTQRNYDAEADDHEAPVHEVDLDAFEVARYPITVVEYAPFVEDKGSGSLRKPDAWDDQRVYPNRPVVSVSWHEALAYCAWRSERDRSTIRLPTEAEWERAARGTEGRRYPWGNEPPGKTRLNYEGQIGHPTPVAVYPAGATPEGVCDLAGNVREWCMDWYGAKYYAQSPKENPQGPESGKYRVARGGSWYYNAWNARAAYRLRFTPDVRDHYLGFRVVRLGARTPVTP